MTVVVSGASGRSYLGRYHEQGEHGVVMHDVGVHDPATAGLDLDAWLARQHRFGVNVDHRRFVVPADEVADIRRFATVLS